MLDAINFIYLVYDKLINLIFNQFQIVQGVSVGWVLVVIVAFGLMIKSILNLPKGLSPKTRDTYNINIERYNENG